MHRQSHAEASHHAWCSVVHVYACCMCTMLCIYRFISLHGDSRGRHAYASTHLCMESPHFPNTFCPPSQKLRHALSISSQFGVLRPTWTSIEQTWVVNACSFLVGIAPHRSRAERHVPFPAISVSLQTKLGATSSDFSTAPIPALDGIQQDVRLSGRIRGLRCSTMTGMAHTKLHADSARFYTVMCPVGGLKNMHIFSDESMRAGMQRGHIADRTSW